MRGMFYNLTRAKQAKALMFHFSEDTDKKKRLKIAEFAVLRALAERMAHQTLKPKGRRTPTIAHTCFPSLESIARDAAMSESTASRAINGLVKKGLIEKEVIHN
jgi:DNA-binding MarR family transcriptional regulator